MELPVGIPDALARRTGMRAPGSDSGDFAEKLLGIAPVFEYATFLTRRTPRVSLVEPG